MSYDIGPKIGIEGESQYRAAMREIVSQTKALNAEMKNIATSFTSADSKEQRLAKTNGVLTKQIQATATKLDLLHSKYDKEIKKLDELDQALESAKAEFGENSKEAQKAQNAYNDQAVVVNKLGAQLNNTEAELNQMTHTLEENTNKWKLAGERMTEFGTNLGAIGDGLKSVGTTLTKSVTAPLVGVATAAVKVGMDFDSEMSKVSAISGAVGDDFERLREAAREMGSKTKFSASEAAEALEYMALAGWSVDEMVKKNKDGTSSLSAVLNLAAAAGMDLGEASDIVTDYMTAFGLSVDEAGMFVDQLAYAMANSNTDVSMLGEAYKNCAATAESMGYAVEDVTAVLMTMANAGVKGGESGTALNTIMTRLATNTNGCADTLAEYGVQVYDSQGNMNTLSEILNGVSSMWGQLTDEQQAGIAKTIAGTKQYSALQTVMAGLGDDAVAVGKSFNDYASALADCEGTAAEMAETMQDNLSGQLTTLLSTVQEIGIGFSDVLTPALSNVVSAVQGAAASIAGMDNDTKKAIVTIAGIAAVIGPAIAAVGTIVTAVGGAVTAVGGVVTALSAGTGVVAAVGTALGALAGPITLVVALVAGLAIAVVTHWDSIKETVSGATSAVKNTVVSGFTSVGNFLAGVWEGITTAVSTAFNAVKTTTTNAFNAVKSAIITPLNTAKTTVTNILGNIKSAFAEKLGAARDTVKSIIDRIKGFFNFSWSLPKLKLPHVSISGKFSLVPPSVPKFSISWYRKAYDNAMLLSDPTIFGYANGSFLGGGDGNGTEVVAGAQTLMGMMKSAINEEMGNQLGRIVELMEAMGGYMQQSAQRKVVLSTGELVGALVDPLDTTMGKMAARKERGR